MPQGKTATVVKKYPQLIHTNLTSAGSDDVFPTKYDSRGNLVWVNQTGGANQDIGQNVCADTNGNVYVVGKLPKNGNPTDQVTLTNARRPHFARLNSLYSLCACIIILFPVFSKTRRIYGKIDG
jgi:hypothetical protein